jgi:hypothetical protein
MALNNFIPVVWAGMILANLNKALVYGQPTVVNKNYEGEITAYGDTVKINSIGPILVRDYVRDTDMVGPDALTDATRSLLINRAKNFNFVIDDLDKAQQNPKVMEEATREAAYALANEADAFLASLYTGVAAGNTIGDDTTPIVPTATTAYEYLVDMGVLLDEANVPSMGRWCIVPSWFHGLLLKDARFVQFGGSGQESTLRNGQVGEAAGFAIMKSNNVPSTAGTKFKIMAGYPGAITYAEQIGKVEGYRPEKRFADALKGLHLYGARVVRPSGLAVMTANKS